LLKVAHFRAGLAPLTARFARFTAISDGTILALPIRVAREVRMSRPLRSVVVVGGRPGRAPNLHNLLVDTNDYDVIFVESIARGYSRIKQVTPDFVIVVLGIDDVAACQLLSMMKIDRDVSRIPMVTWARQREESELEDEIAEWDQDSPRWSLAVPMN
jgi:hypothetical protein